MSDKITNEIDKRLPYKVWLISNRGITSNVDWKTETFNIPGTVVYAAATPSWRAANTPVQLYTTFSDNTVTVHYKNATDWAGDGYSLLVLYR